MHHFLGVGTSPYNFRLLVDISRGPEDRINMKMSDSGSKANIRGIPEMLFCRILMFMPSFGALISLELSKSQVLEEYTRSAVASVGQRSGSPRPETR